MRLLIVGTLDGHIATAGKLAMDSGAKVAHVDDIGGAMTALRSGQGADLVMVEVKLPPDALPLNLVAYSPCFRREKMSAGKDTRGIKRGHQFDKVGLVKLVAPGTGREHLDQLVAHAVAVLTRLQIPYRIVQMCTGDLSFTAAAKHDVEAWAPGCGEWLEVSSCSFFRDFQARRAEIRFRPRTGGKAEYAHTLNGSGLALPRTLIAVVENYQQPDGSIRVPDALRPYLGGQEVLAPDRRLP